MANDNYSIMAPLSAGSVTVAYTGTAGTTVALNSLYETIRVMSTTDCFIEIGRSPTAVANTGMYLVAFSPEYFRCERGTKVSAIQVSSGGSIYVTPMS